MVQVALIYWNSERVRVTPETYPETVTFPELKSVKDLTRAMVKECIVDLIMEGKLAFRGGIEIDWVAIDDQKPDKPAH